MKKIIKVKNRNPIKSHRYLVSKILANSSFWDYLSEGDYGDVYYFVVKNKLKVRNTILQPGEYVLKIQKHKERNLQIIKRFERLSKLGLIPKIYYIDNRIIIMKYIPGKPYLKLYLNFSTKENNKVLDRIQDLINEWHSHNEAHIDLHMGNVLVDKNLNVYFIDPSEQPKTIDYDFEDDNDAYDVIRRKVLKKKAA